MTLPGQSADLLPKRILCPTDFTPSSVQALDYALAIARPLGAEIVVLHVVLLPLPSVEPEDKDWIPAEPGMRAELLLRLEQFSSRCGDVPIRRLLAEGNPADEILRQARVLDAGLIVMGSHGRRGFERWLLGSHAERVLRLAPCPVLTAAGLPDASILGTPPRLGEVLCAASSSRHAPETIEYAQALALRLSAHLTLLHVSDPRRDTPPVAPWAGRLSTGVARVEERLTLGSPCAEILQCARERAAQLVVVGAHDRGPGSHGFMGSTADHIVRDARCGVLTVKTLATVHRSSPTAEDALAASER